MVVANLSRFVQFVELDLSRFKGMTPVELIGRTSFPPIGDLPYLLTLAPHTFFWFSIEQPKTSVDASLPEYRIPSIDVSSNLAEILRANPPRALERILPDYLPHCRWFRSKARTLKNLTIRDSVPMGEGLGAPQLVLLEVEYQNAGSEVYLLPLAIAVGDRARDIRSRWPERVIAEIVSAAHNGEGNAILYDAVIDYYRCLTLFWLAGPIAHLPPGLTAEAGSGAMHLLLWGTPKHAAVLIEQSHRRWIADFG
jgi:maltose alpha-D-glucosyltransferase/alpha-amylase